MTPDGWLRTGDMARVDDAGRIELVGRRREMYIRGGYNVYPAEVEAILASHVALVDVAVAPRGDEVMGEVGVAVVVVRDGHDVPSLDDLRAHAAPHLARWKLPEALLVVGELPTTAMQKLDRRALAHLVRAR
jgi:acyl-CoA synthetase (AMP-forming)/AMP-acid ligase II